MTVRSWLITLCIFFLLSMLVLLGINRYVTQKIFSDVTLPELTKSLYRTYEVSLKNVVDVQAQNLANHLIGVTDPKEQRVLIEKLTDPQRFFEGEGYYFTYDSKCVRINVPVNKSLNGKDCTNLKDAAGVYMVQEMLKAAQNGGGYTKYSYDKPGFGIQPKLSYSCMIPGTEYYIGTGIYIDTVQNQLAAIQARIAKEDSEFIMYQTAASLFIMLLMGALNIWLAAKIGHPLQQLIVAVKDIAKGVLDTRLPQVSFGEPHELRVMRDALTSMISTLKTRIQESEEKTAEAAQATEKAEKALYAAGEAKRRADAARKEGTIAAAAKLEKVATEMVNTVNQLSQQINDAAKGADESSNRLTEAATAMNEMNATVQEVAKNASSAAQDSTNTKNKAEEGSQVVERSVDSIAQAHTLSLALKQDMEQLSEHAKNITQIMSVISDIADQTNLLALNAAIEAARAGDAGRGFAVVADEVRKLAEKTMASTTDVGNVINAIQVSTNKSVAALETAVTQIEEATNLANKSGEFLTVIVSTVDTTATEISSIATASEEQSAASEEINQSIAQVDNMARGTATSMESASQALVGLNQQAQSLKQLIEDIKTQG